MGGCDGSMAHTLRHEPPLPLSVIPPALRFSLTGTTGPVRVSIFIQLYEYIFTMNKALRQRAVLEALKRGPVANQEDLQRALRKRGFKVGQATLSRDIRDLNLSKTAAGYTLSQGEGAGLALPPVERLVREFVLDVRPAQNLLVVKTIVGSAQPVAAALDEQEWGEVVGTIAGDDAILIVCPDKDAAKKVAVRIEEMLG